ncbi:hypothetical protein TNCV_1122591 [Trichonephila clavipes]|uniref:Uncharacterized protein n=1 Tax=Trichonephila clavipes TaxID=2585209 RepID=A0A8X6SCP8_TRICX|nr:hypothetical protein TNCV_1122591 [Trichonephila clavipes]
MAATLTLSECFVSDMDWEATEVRVEEMEWAPSYIEGREPMDWEDIFQVRASKRSKNIPSTQHKKVSLPLEPKPNPSFQGKLAPSISQKVNPITSEFIRHKISCKPKVSIPEVSAPTNRVVLNSRRPSLSKV